MILLFKISISLICYNKKLSMMVRCCSYNITRSEGGVKKNTENIVNQSTCMVFAPPMMIMGGGGGGGGHFSGPVEEEGVYFFIWTVGRLLHMGQVTIRDFPGGTPVPISCPIGKRRTQFCRSETVIEKFVESSFIKLSFLMSLHLCDNLVNVVLIKWDIFLFTEYVIGAPKKARCFLK